MAYRIQLKRGNKADLPAVAYPGEPLFCLDTGDFYIGTGTGILQMCRDTRTFYQATQPSSGMSPGDLWYDTNNSEIRRWNGSTWELMDVAAGSGSYAYAQDDAPTDGMSTGDLWIDTNDSNKIYRYSGTEWVLMRDGGIASALQDAAAAIAAVDGKITSFYQDSPPTEGMAEGDIWFDTDDGNKIYIYESEQWVSRQDSNIAKAIQDAATAKGIADGKVATYFDETEPSDPAVGDLWYKESTNSFKRWNGTNWKKVATVNHTFSQGTPPASDMILGDIWIDTDDGNKFYRYNGSQWVLLRDEGIAQALQDAATAQSTADGKITSFYQDSPPTEGMADGDIWFDTNDGNKIYVYETDTWVARQDSLIAQAIQDAATAQSTADGKITTFYSTSTPTGMKAGDLWYNSDTMLLKRYVSGTTWDVVSNSYSDPADFTSDTQGLLFYDNMTKAVTLATGGVFRTAESPNPRIEITKDFITGYSDADTKQFYLNASDGKAYAGAGAVTLDLTGITINQGGDKVNRISWTSGANKVTGTDMGEYTCILNHVSSNDDKPVTGANWATYWAKTGDLGFGYWYADYYYHAAETDNITMLYGYDDPGNNRVYTTLHTRGDYVGASAETRIRARCAEGKTASVYLYVNDKYIKLSQFGSNTAKLEIPSGVELHTYGDLYTFGNADVYVTGGVSIGSRTNENPSIGDLWVQSGIHVGYQSYAAPGDGRVIAEGYIETASKFVSTLATGNKPIDVASTTVCTNLNADMVDGKHAGGANGLAVLNADAKIAYATIQNVSATDKILGRVSSGAGSIEEITCTAAGRALLDDASAAAQCTTLGLGTSSTPQFERLGIGTTAPTSGTHQLKISDASAGDWHQTLLLLQPNLPNGYKGAGVAFGRDYGAELPYGYAMMFFTPDATTPTSATQIEWRMVGTNTLAYITGAGLLGARGGLKTAGGGLDGTLGTVSTLHHVNYPTSYTHNVATSHSSTAANNHLAFNLCNGGADTTIEVLRLVGNGHLGLGVAAPAYDITFAQGAARTVGIQRRTDSNSAGNFLYVRGGDATIAATNCNGGTLHLQPGLCTGSGYGRVKIYGCLGPGSGSPTTDGTLQTLIDCCDSRIGFFGATPAAKQTLAAYTSDSESSAYTTTGSGADIASKADLNALRTAYETLRAMCEDLRTKVLATTLLTS